MTQLATVNARIGRIFNQSVGANTDNETNMHDIRTLIDTRRYETNKGCIDCNCLALQPLTDKTTANSSTMNNENNKNTKIFRTDGQLRYHWGADDDNMAIINRRDKSPETTELVKGASNWRDKV